MSRWTLADLPDQSGRTILVTGANSGLGFHTSLELARKGARVLMACRNPARAEDALSRIKEEAPSAQTELVALDLASLASVEEAARDVAARTTSLDVLVNNAGIMAVAKGTTADGFESQLGTNHLGHFALTGRLLPLLLAAADKPRVVTVSSYAHKIGKIDFHDLMGDKRYGRWSAYAQSKLANLLFTAELDRRYGDRLTALAAHPGYASTHLQEGQGQPFFELLMRLGNRLFAQSDVMGAWPTLRAATDPEAQGDDYYGPHALMELRGNPVKVGRVPAARDVAVARRLWEVSEELTGVVYPSPL
jgi:NAD(P)-dependent dehydrogenase (short-subunit alcohol dehydrogenase family)